jgi:ATPase components of various ABC-type transport systems, contain duplicated ATPase
MSILSVRDFSLDLKNDAEWKSILHHISFDLERGKTIGIVGESGSGKSVTALSIMRLINKSISKINSGAITLFDNDREIDLLALSEKEMLKVRGDKIAMIFQEPMTSLNPVIKCGKQIEEAILLHEKLSKKEVHERVISLFQEVMLPRPEKIYDSYPHELSGGQKQRVMIAMAMSCHPSILIADEPTTALDVTVQKGILELIKKLQQKYGMSVIFITHDLGVVAEIADQLIVLFKGDIVETGEVSAIFNNPQHPYTKGLLACRPPLDCRPKTLLTVDNFMTNYQQESTPENIVISTSERKSYHEKIYAQAPLLRIENLTKSYAVRKKKLFEKQEYVHALKEVSLDVYEGETLGLVGESGCGKTTLGRSMIRLIEPTSGNVYYKGKSLTSLSSSDMRKQRKELQIILQDPYSSLNQRITVGSAIMEPMQVHGLYANDRERKKRAIALLERVSLNESHFYRYPHEFSGGQRQRISIARALAVEPKFIICDESVSALDVSVQAQVLNLLNELKAEYHFTYIFISHDLSVVKFMSDRMAVMQNGSIVELDDADNVYNTPQTDYAKQLIAAIPAINLSTNHTL